MLNNLWSLLKSQVLNFPYETVFTCGDQIKTPEQRDLLQIRLAKATRYQSAIVIFTIESESDLPFLSNLLEKTDLSRISLIIYSDLAYLSSQLRPATWVVKLRESTFRLLLKNEIKASLCDLIEGNTKVIFELEKKGNWNYDKEIEFLANSGYSFVFPWSKQSAAMQYLLSNKVRILKDRQGDRQEAHTSKLSSDLSITAPETSWLKNLFVQCSNGFISKSECLGFLLDQSCNFNIDLTVS